MRVLYLCHRIPYPPNKGEKIRAFHQLRGMAERHEVDLFTLVDQPEDLPHQQALRSYCREVTVASINSRLARLGTLPYLLTRTPLTAPYFYSAELARAVRKARARRSYDRIFVYCSPMAQYVDAAEQAPVLMDLVDVDSDKWTQYATRSRFPFSTVYRREGQRLEEFERKACRRSAAVLVTTRREGELARRIAGNTPVHVVPNGVDGDFFHPPAEADGPRPPAVVFTGDMSYFPNEDAAVYFAHQVLPLIRRSNADIRFLIVGRNPSRKVQELGAIPGVEVTGFVPDVREYLARAQVAVAPFSITAGIPNKILEALASGLPVVATERAVQGLSPKMAEAIEIAEGAEDFAAKVLELLEDRALACRKGIEGRRCVIAEHNWERMIDRLMQLLENPRSTAGAAPLPAARAVGE